MAQARRISDAHMVCTPHPRISCIFLTILGVLVGFGFHMTIWRKRGGNCLYDLSSFISLNNIDRICGELSL